MNNKNRIKHRLQIPLNHHTGSALEGGFTLIETLIAVLIIAIALSALLYTSSNSINAQTHIENTIVANWIGENTLVAHEYELNDYLKTHQTTHMLNKTWIVESTINDELHPIQTYLIDITQQPSHFHKRITGYHYHDPFSL